MHESGESFCLKDAEDQILGYFYYEDEPGRRQQLKRLTRDQARRIAVNIMKLADYCSTRRRRPRNLTASCAFPSAIPLTLAVKMHRRPLQALA